MNTQCMKCDSKGCGWLWEEESEKEELQRVCKQLLHCTLTNWRKPTLLPPPTPLSIWTSLPSKTAEVWTCTDDRVKMEVNEAGETTMATSWYEAYSTLNVPLWLLVQAWACVGVPWNHVSIKTQTWNLWSPFWHYFGSHAQQFHDQLGTVHGSLLGLFFFLLSISRCPLPGEVHPSVCDHAGVGPIFSPTSVTLWGQSGIHTQFCCFFFYLFIF